MPELSPEKKDLSTYLDNIKNELTAIKASFSEYQKNIVVMNNTKNLLNSFYNLVNTTLEETKKKELNLTEIKDLKESDLETFINQVDKLKTIEIDLDLSTLEAKYKSLTDSTKEINDLKKQVGEKQEAKVNDIQLDQDMWIIFGDKAKIDLTNVRKPRFIYTNESGTETKVDLKWDKNFKYYYFELDSKTYKIQKKDNIYSLTEEVWKLNKKLREEKSWKVWWFFWRIRNFFSGGFKPIIDKITWIFNTFKPIKDMFSGFFK